MEIARNILLLLHLAGMAGILVSLLQSRSKLSAGVTHSALLALTAGHLGKNESSSVELSLVNSQVRR